jgi:ligand-binding sensor domain-containing protein
MKKKRKLLIFILFLFFGQKALYSQKLYFEQLSTRQGLPSNMVNCIVQDNKGFLWFGTGAGLTRYDGYTFKTFQHDPENDKTISNNYIVGMVIDKDGRFWIATSYGLNKFEPSTELFTRYFHDSNQEQTLASNEMWYIFLGKTDNLLISTNKGLSLFDIKNETFKSYPNKTSSPYKIRSQSVACAIEDSEGYV